MTPEPMSLSRRLLRLPVIALAMAAALTVQIFCLALLLLGMLASNPDVVLPRLQAVLNDAGYLLEVRAMDLSLKPLSLKVEGLALSSRDHEGLDVELGHLSAGLSLLQGLEGKGWVRRVRVDRPQVRLVLGEDSGGDRDGTPDPQRFLRLLSMDELAVSNGTVLLDSPGSTLRLSGLDLALAEADGASVLSGTTVLRVQDDQGRAIGSAEIVVDVNGTASAARARFRVQELGFDHPLLAGTGHASALLVYSKGQLLLQELAGDFQLARLTFPEGGQLQDLPVRVETVAKGTPLGLSLKAEGLLDLTATMDGNLLHKPQAKISGKVWSGAVMQGMRPLLPESLRDMVLQGPVPVEASYAPDAGYRVALMPEQLQVRLPLAGAHATLTGSLQVNATRQGPARLGVDLSAENVGIELNSLQVGRGGMSIKAEGTMEQLTVSRLTVRVPAGQYRLPGLEWSPGGLFLEGRLTVAGTKQVEVSALTLRMDTVGSLTGSGSIQNGQIRGSLSSGPLALPDLLGVAPDGLLRGWSADGSVAVSLKAQGSLEQPEIKGEAAIRDLNLGSPDGNILAMIERGRLGAARQASGRYALELDLETGECLVDTVYLSFADHPLHVRALARPDAAFTGLDQGEVDLSLGGMFDIQGRQVRMGFQEGLTYSGRINAGVDSLGQVFKVLVKDPFAASHPGLGQVSLAGRARLEGIVQGRGKRADVAGSLEVEELDASSGEDVRVTDCRLDLPLGYHFGGSEKDFSPPRRPERWGRLSIGRAVTPLGELSSLDMKVSLVPNRLFVQGGVTMPVHGSGLTLRDLMVDRPLGPDFRATLELGLGRLDLEKVPLGPYRFEGSLTGDLGRVVVDRERMSVTGGLKGSFYGGDLRVTNIMARQPFSPSRVLGADVSIREMDLKGFTTTLGAGLITGRMNVELDDFQMAYGQPVGFKLRAESVRSEEVEQEVSLEAVDSISVVGTGQGITSTAVNIFRTFVQRFDYEKIGIACTLNNDVFKVNGLVHEDGVEYLIKKPLLFGINVINRNPENRIRFSDMVDRVQRVLESDKTPQSETENQEAS